MDKFFGKKAQFSDAEYDLARDLNVFHTRESLERDKFIRWRQVEEKLDMREPIVWREFLEPLRSQRDVSFLHPVFQLSERVVKEWFAVLCRVYPKKRTIVLFGPSNTGKSLLANALVAPIAPGYIQRDGGTNVHWLENIYRKSVIIWEEPSIHMTNIEDTKLLLGGETIVINRKNKALIERPAGPAVIVTTNRQFWAYEPAALQNRCFIYARDNIVRTDKIIARADVIEYLCAVHDGRFSERVVVAESSA